jgi:membrane-associated phospholipid phosphatase
MDALQAFGIRLIQAIQAFSPTFDGVMNLFTFLGKIEFYLLIIPFIYWAVDNRLGIRVLLVLIAIDILGSTFKLLFHQPRPYWIGDVKALAEETSYGIPSTHASDSLAVWGYLIYRLKKTWLWIVGVAFIVFIGLSRLYLGVHFPHDVVFGWLLGAVLLWAFVKFENPIATWAKQQSMWMLIGIGFALSLVVIVVGQLIQAWLVGIPDPAEWSAFATQARTPAYSFTLAGALFGSISGYMLMKLHAPFRSDGRWLQRAGRYGLGIIGVLLIYFGLDVLFGLIAADATTLGYALRYLRYATVTIWMTFLAPWVFLKLRLADRQLG